MCKQAFKNGVTYLLSMASMGMYVCLPTTYVVWGKVSQASGGRGVAWRVWPGGLPFFIPLTNTGIHSMCSQ